MQICRLVRLQVSDNVTDPDLHVRDQSERPGCGIDAEYYKVLRISWLRSRGKSACKNVQELARRMDHNIGRANPSWDVWPICTEFPMVELIANKWTTCSRQSAL